MYYFNMFFIFSILGHFIENFFYKHKDSGILYGFWTPIYGVGVVIILLIYNFINKFIKNKLLKVVIVFFSCAFILSLMEILGGFLIEKIFHTTFWDYSNHLLNIGKYTSIEMSLLWGTSSIILIYLIRPIIGKLEKIIPNILTYILIFLFVLDLAFTILPKLF